MVMSEHTRSDQPRTGRREFLRVSFVIGAGAVTGLLAACAPGAPSAPVPTLAPPPTSAPAAAPQPTSAPKPAPTTAPAAAAAPTTATASSTASGTLTVVQGADITTTDPFQIQAIRGMHTSM